MKARWLLVISITIVAVRLALRMLGADAHASVVAGMPLRDASLVLGPLVVVASLASAIVAPTLALAACLVAAGDQLTKRDKNRR